MWSAGCGLVQKFPQRHQFSTLPDRDRAPMYLFMGLEGVIVLPHKVRMAELSTPNQFKRIDQTGHSIVASLKMSGR
jgi:hypothetical protein